MGVQKFSKINKSNPQTLIRTFLNGKKPKLKDSDNLVKRQFFVNNM